MKLYKCIVLFSLIVINATNGKAQVTKLFNNNNIEFGVPLGTIAVLVSANDSLWRTDGTPAGTFKYATNVALDSPSNLAMLGNKIYFTGTTAASGKELWVTDGTLGGTTIVKDIQAGSGSSRPTNITVVNNTLYFIATTTANGTEIWKSDGTDAGTVIVKDINVGPGSGVTVTTILTEYNGKFYFGANSGTTGVEPWVSNGTDPGTFILQDISPSGSSNPAGFTGLGANVFFSASAPTTGAELYKTNGTPGGTGMVMDIATGIFGSSPSQFLPFNGKLYFDALDFTNGFELWSTDGTTTALVKDIDPGINSGFPLLFNSVFINNKFYFSATTTNEGNELWVSDGTTLGTQMLKDINPLAASADPLIMLDFYSSQSFAGAHSSLFNGKIFFSANNGTTGDELWITDGTLAGTVLVKDINPGIDSSIDNSFNYIYTQNALFLDATNGSTGHELYRSTGTGPGTTPVIDLYPGQNGSYPRFLMILNNRILFTANDGDNVNGDRDLYRIEELVNPLPLQLLDFAAIPSGKSVLVNWITTTEINCSHFEIERSKDGILFENTGQVNALNSTRRNSYAYTDINALVQGSNKLFYRLKIVDRDGQFTYSKVAVVNIRPGKDIFYVYPNPVQDKLTVTFNSNKESDAALMISDVSGKQMFSRSIKNLQGTNQHNVDVSSFPAGVYNIRYITAEGTRSVQFVKK